MLHIKPRILSFFLLLCSSALAAQSVCDSLRLDSIRYAPFGNGLHISLFHGGMGYLGSPIVGVVNAANDTLHHGAVEVFGIGPGPSLHQARFDPPASPFSGTVVFRHYNSNGEMVCDLEFTDMELCHPSACVPVQVFAYQQGANPAPTDLVWSLRDADDNTVGSGVLQMDSIPIAFVTAELCLPPGNYTLQMAQPVAAGNVFQVGMMQEGFSYTDGVTVQMAAGGSVELAIPYYLDCLAGAQGIELPENAAPSIVLDGRLLQITGSNGPLGALLVLDSAGRVLRRITAAGPSTSVDLSGLAAGAYLLRPLAAKSWPTQRFVLP